MDAVDVGAAETLILRAPTAADLQSLANWVDSEEACRRWAGPNLRFPFSITELSQQLAVSNGHSRCLSVEGGAAVAFGQYWPSAENTVHLGRIIVAPAERGRGRGRAFCRMLIGEVLRDENKLQGSILALTLRVYRDNRRASALYTSLGFREVSELSDDVVCFMRMKRNILDVRAN